MDKNSQIDSYFIVVKAFLVDAEGRLLITKDRFGYWDIPGGRLREGDFNLPLEKVLDRKLKEELGDAVNYELGEPVVFMRHEREEILPDGSKDMRRIFAIGYQAQYLEGNIQLGASHKKFEWVPLDTFVPEDYFKGGWLKGVKEFQEKNSNLA